MKFSTNFVGCQDNHLFRTLNCVSHCLAIFFMAVGMRKQIVEMKTVFTHRPLSTWLLHCTRQRRVVLLYQINNITCLGNIQTKEKEVPSGARYTDLKKFVYFYLAVVNKLLKMKTVFTHRPLSMWLLHCTTRQETSRIALLDQ